MSDESNFAKSFNAILEDIRNNKKVTVLTNVKSHGESINLHTVIRKFIKSKTTLVEGNYGFDEAFNFF